MSEKNKNRMIKSLIVLLLLISWSLVLNNESTSVEPTAAFSLVVSGLMIAQKRVAIPLF